MKVNSSNYAATVSLLLLSFVVGCVEEPETRIAVRANYDESWGLTSMTFKANNTLRTAKIQSDFTIVIPEDWPQGELTIEFFGLVDTDKKAYAKTSVVPQQGKTVAIDITLQTLACAAVCTEGETRCEADGVATCVLVQGCPAWSAAVTCDAATPFCSNGVCAATCSDECSAGAKRCDDATGAQVCGQFDADNCLEWQAPVACTEEQACKNNVCAAVPPVATFQHRISSNYFHGCAIRNDRTVACWGKNDRGQATPPAGAFLEVAVGYNFSCAINANKQIQCWGEIPAPPTGVHSRLTAGFRSACAISAANDVNCFGDISGQFDKQAKVSAGSDFHCGVSLANKLSCFCEDATDPVCNDARPAPSVVTDVASGEFHVCALKQDRTAACYGEYSAENPAAKFVALESGLFDTCGIRYKGSVECWARRPTISIDTPPTGTFAAIANGISHACGIRTDGSITCWGGNSEGQLNAPTGNFLP